MRMVPNRHMATAPRRQNTRVDHSDLRENDILKGRGGNYHRWVGNNELRRKAWEKRNVYKALKQKRLKTNMATEIRDRIIQMGGRFLDQDQKSGDWIDISHTTAAREKVTQCLRDAVSGGYPPLHEDHPDIIRPPDRQSQPSGAPAAGDNQGANPGAAPTDDARPARPFSNVGNADMELPMPQLDPPECWDSASASSIVETRAPFINPVSIRDHIQRRNTFPMTARTEATMPLHSLHAHAFQGFYGHQPGNQPLMSAGPPGWVVSPPAYGPSSFLSSGIGMPFTYGLGGSLSCFPPLSSAFSQAGPAANTQPLAAGEGRPAEDQISPTASGNLLSNRHARESSSENPDQLKPISLSAFGSKGNKNEDGNDSSETGTMQHAASFDMSWFAPLYEAATAQNEGAMNDDTVKKYEHDEFNSDFF